MINKKKYHEIKNYIKVLSRPQIKQLCDDMELTDDEKKLLLETYDGFSVTKICMTHYISNYTYTNNMHIIYSKINNYLVFTSK